MPYPARGHDHKGMVPKHAFEERDRVLGHLAWVVRVPSLDLGDPGTAASASQKSAIVSACFDSLCALEAGTSSVISLVAQPLGIHSIQYDTVRNFEESSFSYSKLVKIVTLAEWRLSLLGVKQHAHCLRIKTQIIQWSWFASSCPIH